MMSGEGRLHHLLLLQRLHSMHSSMAKMWGSGHQSRTWPQPLCCRTYAPLFLTVGWTLLDGRHKVAGSFIHSRSRASIVQRQQVATGWPGRAK